MKKFLSLMMAMIMACSLIACGAKENAPAVKEGTQAGDSAAAEEAPVETRVLKVATQNLTTSVNYISYQAFSDNLYEKTNGRYKLEIYPNGELGTEEACLQQVLTGTLDMLPVSVTTLGNVVDEMNIFAFPFMIESYDAFVDFATNEEFRTALYDAVKEQTGCQALGFGYAVGRGVGNSKREVRTVDDLKGLKIRTLGNPIIVDTYNAFGATATSVPFKEVYTALQQNMIDGEDSTVSSNLDQRFCEINRHFTILNSTFQSACMLVSPTVWDSIPAEDQEIFIQCGIEMDQYGFELCQEHVQNEIQRAHEQEPDFKIIEELTPEEKATFVEAARPVWDDYIDDCGKEFFDWAYAIAQECNEANR
jgi:tripartite ATP-independent transporter DctP family solute receptor